VSTNSGAADTTMNACNPTTKEALCKHHSDDTLERVEAGILRLSESVINVLWQWLPQVFILKRPVSVSADSGAADTTMNACNVAPSLMSTSDVSGSIKQVISMIQASP